MKNEETTIIRSLAYFYPPDDQNTLLASIVPLLDLHEHRVGLQGMVQHRDGYWSRSSYCRRYI